MEYVYIVEEDWANDSGEKGSNSEVFHCLKDAQVCFDKAVKAAMTDYADYFDESGSPVEGYVLNQSRGEPPTIASWEFYWYGYYDLTHTSITITRKEVK